MKKLLFILLTICLIMAVIPFGIFSFTASAATSGATGTCAWSLDGTVLTISGNGAMANFTSSAAAPWGKSITKVIIKDGVTSIGGYAFNDCTSLTSIDEAVFVCCYSLM